MFGENTLYTSRNGDPRARKARLKANRRTRKKFVIEDSPAPIKLLRFLSVTGRIANNETNTVLFCDRARYTTRCFLSLHLLYLTKTPYLKTIKKNFFYIKV
ncbi:hypothetical protein PUN28_004884 [Cardiocondyla obscurior]|uniref:Uncharacterized protein n=1 Tax=Cardiocondyla obscurior TaxID=286306 RepID=A0AAW2GGV2_9HYME